MPTWTNNTD